MNISEIQVNCNMIIQSINNLKHDNDNHIFYYKKNGELLEVQTVEGCSFKFSGINNSVVIGEAKSYYNCRFSLVNNCTIIIMPSSHDIKCLSVTNWKFNNQLLFINNDFSCGGCKIVLPSTNMYIGTDCMFSYGIEIWGEDGHAIFNPEGKCINKDGDMYIGNHVWIGCNSTILKKISISDNSVVGTRTVLSRSVDIPGSIIVGNPGRVVKTGYNWSRNSPHLL